MLYWFRLSVSRWDQICHFMFLCHFIIQFIKIYIKICLALFIRFILFIWALLYLSRANDLAEMYVKIVIQVSIMYCIELQSVHGNDLFVCYVDFCSHLWLGLIVRLLLVFFLFCLVFLFFCVGGGTAIREMSIQPLEWEREQ